MKIVNSIISFLCKRFGDFPLTGIIYQNKIKCNDKQSVFNDMFFKVQYYFIRSLFFQFDFMVISHIFFT